MNRTLKVLVVALVTLGALSTIGASAAWGQKQGILTSASPVALKGEETGELLQNASTSTLGSFTCPGSIYAGHKYNVTPHTWIPIGATTATITPSYASECKAHIPILGTRPGTVTMNGCDYVGHIGETTGGENTYGLTVDVVCPEGKQIEREIFKSGSVTHAAADRICTTKIKPQTGLKGAHVKTTTETDDIDMEGTIEGIHEESSGTLCGSTTSATGKLDIDLTVTGEASPGAGVTVSD
ncbi:MAG: hypothetical protein WA687_01490 [Solirubrobacterales bacterium]